MPKNNINLWWPATPRPGNLGDVLSVPILESLSYSVSRANLSTDGKMLAIGSIVRKAKDKDVVWGSGLISREDQVNRKARYLAVRGPITGERVECDIYGDPALLCSLLFPLQRLLQPGRAPDAVVPHYVDRLLAKPAQNVISPLTIDPVSTARKIGESLRVFSSSLHGIIIAHSYGIPAGWWRPSDNLYGDDVKFEDYAESMGIAMRPSKALDDVEFVCPDPKVVSETQQRLIRALENHEPS